MLVADSDPDTRALYSCSVRVGAIVGPDAVATFVSQRVIRTSAAPFGNPPHAARHYKFDSKRERIVLWRSPSLFTWDGAGIATVRVERVEMPLEFKGCHESHRSHDASAQIVQSGCRMSRHPSGVMRVRLLRKLADRLDGIDVSEHGEGDIVDLPRAQARLLIAERWALPFRGPSRERRARSMPREHIVAADRSELRTLEQLRRVRKEMETKRCEQQERRRAEDRIREELHDSRAKTLSSRK